MAGNRPFGDFLRSRRTRLKPDKACGATSSGAFTTSDYAKVGVVSVLIAIAYGICVITSWYALQGIPIWNPTAPWPSTY
jgi:hypothetical protein